MKKYWAKFKIFWKELGNILTNLACPFLSILAAILEIFNMPTSWIQNVKKVEYWCWEAYGTKKELDKIIQRADDVLNTLEGKTNDYN